MASFIIQRDRTLAGWGWGWGWEPEPFGACGTRPPVDGACGTRAPCRTRDPPRERAPPGRTIRLSHPSVGARGAEAGDDGQAAARARGAITEETTDACGADHADH